MGRARLFVSAGDPSGDQAVARVIAELKNRVPELETVGLGGPRLAELGQRQLADQDDISVMGFWEVAKRFGFFRRLMQTCVSEIEAQRPNAVLLVDYPGFNLRLAKKIKKRFPVLYYVSPQIWAWGGRRIHTIRRNIHHMMVLFSFEETLYREAGVPVTWVGHPLVDLSHGPKKTEELKKEFGISSNQKVIALLAGSRENEIRRILPVMLKAAAFTQNMIKEAVFLLSESANVSPALYNAILKREKRHMTIMRIKNRMHELLGASDCAMVTSGTATLETALSLTPFVILYKTGWSTYLVGRQLIRIPYIGLVNVIAKRKMISEYIQHEADPRKIAAELSAILSDADLQQEIIQNLKAIQKELGPPGASGRAAHVVLKELHLLP